MTLREILIDWEDSDVAAHALGVCLGLWPEGLESFQEHKGIYWTNNPLGNHLDLALVELVKAGVLEMEDDDPRGLRYRWKPSSQ